MKEFTDISGNYINYNQVRGICMPAGGTKLRQKDFEHIDSNKLTWDKYQNLLKLNPSLSKDSKSGKPPTYSQETKEKILEEMRKTPTLLIGNTGFIGKLRTKYKVSGEAMTKFSNQIKKEFNLA